MKTVPAVRRPGVLPGSDSIEWLGAAGYAYRWAALVVPFLSAYI
jgi:hypothetical protein